MRPLSRPEASYSIVGLSGSRLTVGQEHGPTPRAPRTGLPIAILSISSDVCDTCGRRGFPPQRSVRPPAPDGPKTAVEDERPGRTTYSVEIEGSAWTLCGTICMKFSCAEPASERIRSASESWPLPRSSSA